MLENKRRQAVQYALVDLSDKAVAEGARPNTVKTIHNMFIF